MFYLRVYKKKTHCIGLGLPHPVRAMGPMKSIRRKYGAIRLSLFRLYDLDHSEKIKIIL